MLLMCYLQKHDWTEGNQTIHLSTVVRTIIQMTIDITTLSTAVENDNTTRLFDTIHLFLQILHVSCIYPINNRIKNQPLISLNHLRISTGLFHFVGIWVFSTVAYLTTRMFRFTDFFKV